MSNLNERRAEFVYEGARLAAIAAGAPIIPATWSEREQPFKDQFFEVIERQCGPLRSTSPEELQVGWMRREIERVGLALFTNTKGEYTGTEEDLHAIGQFVEGCVETIERMPELEQELESCRKWEVAAKKVIEELEQQGEALKDKTWEALAPYIASEDVEYGEDEMADLCERVLPLLWSEFVR